MCHASSLTALKQPKQTPLPRRRHPKRNIAQPRHHRNGWTNTEKLWRKKTKDQHINLAEQRQYKDIRVYYIFTTCVLNNIYIFYRIHLLLGLYFIACACFCVLINIYFTICEFVLQWHCYNIFFSNNKILYI